MYIILLGGGEVGYYLCRELLDMGHEVLLIEKDAIKCEHFKEELGSVILCGDGCEMAVLTKAGITRADMFVAVTDEDDDNLAATQIAKQKFNVPQVIARINKPKDERIFVKLGIEHTVNAAALILENIKAQTAIFPLVRLLSFKEKGLELFLVKVLGAPLADKRVVELALPSGSEVPLLIRQGGELVVPDLRTILEIGDQFICLIPSEGEAMLKAIVS